MKEKLAKLIDVKSIVTLVRTRVIAGQAFLTVKIGKKWNF